MHECQYSKNLGAVGDRKEATLDVARYLSNMMGHAFSFDPPLALLSHLAFLLVGRSCGSFLPLRARVEVKPRVTKRKQTYKRREDSCETKSETRSLRNRPRVSDHFV